MGFADRLVRRCFLCLGKFRKTLDFSTVGDATCVDLALRVRDDLG
jgi:hypothetical protein